MVDLELIWYVILVSASGALSPGPLTFSTVYVGVREGWKGGLKVAVGHTIVEAPLVALISLGLSAFVLGALLEKALLLLGGAFILYFSYLSIKDALRGGEFKDPKKALYRSPIVVGIALSLFNPYFLIWWFTVGASLILNFVKQASLSGVPILFASHIWIDYAWLTLVATLGSFTRINIKVYRAVLFALGLALVYLGLKFIISALF